MVSAKVSLIFALYLLNTQIESISNGMVKCKNTAFIFQMALEMI